jgi:hypothetical protein
VTERTRDKEPVQENQTSAYVVRLPGFLVETEIGLGDVIKKVTYAMRVPPCGGCERRAAALNRRIHFGH